MRQGISIAAAAVAALALGAGTAHGAYVKVADPTGAVAGNGGGIVIGAANGERAVEGGICNKQGGAFGAFASYYYLYASAEKPPGNIGYNVEDDDCSGDAPGVRGVSGSESDGTTSLVASVRPNGLATKAVFLLGKAGEEPQKVAEQDAGAGWDRKQLSLLVSDLEDGDYVFRVAATNETGTTTRETAFTVGATEE
jgi:hypothetical protein